MKVLFTESRTVQQGDGCGPTFEAGKVYDLPARSVQRWIMRGVATDDAVRIAEAERVPVPAPTAAPQVPPIEPLIVDPLLGAVGNDGKPIEPEPVTKKEASTAARSRNG